MTRQAYLLRVAALVPPEVERLLEPHRAVSDGRGAWRLTVEAADVRDLRRNLFAVAREESLDLLLAPESAVVSPPRWVFFDGDATLLAGETIDELARVAGVYDEVAAITERAMAGELDFEAGLRQRARLLKGLPATALERVIRSMPLSPGAEETVGVLKVAGIRVGVFSGGFHFLLDRLQERLGLDVVAGNRLEIDDGKLTGRVIGTVVDAAHKARLLCRVVDDGGEIPAHSVAVGDGANDVPMLRAAGLGVAYRAKPALLEAADGVLYAAGLEGLLDLLALR